MPLDPGGGAQFDTILDMRSDSGVMHSAHIAPTGDGARLLWFQGSAEAMPDVEIWAADLNLATRQFGDSFALFDRHNVTLATTPGQPVLILGNTVQGQPGSRETYLSTVVSAGGWAAASVAEIRTLANVPVSARKLPLSPFLNRSTLVRNGAIAFGDGHVALPAYHELVAGFGLLVRLGPDGRVRSTARIGHGKLVIQPEIVVTGPKTAVALLRPFDRSGRLFRAETIDGGQNWTHPAPIAGLENPDAPVAAILLSDGRILMAANTDRASAENMSLLVSGNHGRSWQKVAELDNFGTGAQRDLRYPDLERLTTGEILLTYSTFSKQGIRAHLFNEAWINRGG